MARVPVAVENEVRLAPLSRERIDTQDFGAAGRIVGQGLEQLGNAGREYAEQQDRLDAALDNAGAKTLDNDFVTGAQPIRSGFLSQQGLNAGNARQGAEQSLRDLQSSVMAKATTPRMRKMLSDVVQQRVTSMMGEFAGHVNTQLTRAEDDASQARIGLAGEEAAATTDPMERAQNFATLRSEVAARGKLNGWEPDVTQAETLKQVSGVHANILQNLIVGDNLDGALSYYQQHVGEMSAPDKTRFNTMIRDPLERRQTLNDAGMVMGFAPVQGSSAPAGDVPTPKGMFSTIVGIEGGTGRDGRFLISPKGAVGPAQVMPSTAPEAAKLAGVAWNPEKFRTDHAYNLQLGNAYFNQQLRTFGDPVKAAAAYNAGAGRVKEAVAKYGMDWIAHMPAETQKYVDKFRAGVRTGVQQQPERHDLNDLLGRVDVVGQQEGWSPERIDRAKQEVTRRVGMDERLLDRREDDAQRAALDVITKLGGKKGGVGFTDINQLPADIRANLSPSSKLSFLSMAQQNAAALASGATVKANGPDAYNLTQMAIRDPEGFKRLNLGMYQNKVTDGELENFGKLQAELAVKPPEGTDQGKIWKVVEDGAKWMQIDTTDPKAGAAPSASQARGRAIMLRISDMVRADVASKTDGKRAATDEEIRSSFDRAVRQVVVNGDTAHPVRAYELRGPTDAVPDTDRQQIQAAFQRRYGRLPNEGEIARAYAGRR